jgi:hypothetical protein
MSAMGAVDAMQPQQPDEITNEITNERIIEQAITCAGRSGWTVLVADCRVQVAAAEGQTPRGAPDASDAWFVSMWAQPLLNMTLRKPMPLGCRVQLLEGRLYAVSLYEPSGRTAYLR